MLIESTIKNVLVVMDTLGNKSVKCIEIVPKPGFRRFGNFSCRKYRAQTTIVIFSYNMYNGDFYSEKIIVVNGCALCLKIKFKVLKCWKNDQNLKILILAPFLCIHCVQLLWKISMTTNTYFQSILPHLSNVTIITLIWEHLKF